MKELTNANRNFTHLLSFKLSKLILVILVEENTTGKAIIENACKHVNSWKITEFDIRFNPNLFQPIVRLADSVS